MAEEDDDDESFGDFTFASFPSQTFPSTANDNNRVLVDNDWGDFVNHSSQINNDLLKPFPDPTTKHVNENNGVAVQDEAAKKPKGAIPLSIFGEEEEEEEERTSANDFPNGGVVKRGSGSNGSVGISDLISSLYNHQLPQMDSHNGSVSVSNVAAPNPSNSKGSKLNSIFFRGTMARSISSFFFVFALSLIASQISAEESSETKEFVLTLDHTNFHDTVSKHDFIVIEFYAPWCGHCKKLAPEFEKAASILSSHDPPIVLAKVDANEEKNKELAMEYDVKGYPTIKIVRNGGKNIQEYKGPREADGIVDYLKKQNGPASTEIKSADEATALIGENKIAIVGVFPKFSGEEFDNFIALAEKLRAEYDFGHTLNAKHLPRGESSVAGPLIRLFKPFDELFVDSKDFHVDTLEKFVEESSTPVVTVFNNDPNNHPFVVKFFNSPNAKAMMFINFTAESAESFKSKYREAAEQYKQQGVSFLVGDVESSQGAFQYFGLKEEQVPLIIIQHNDGKKFFKSNLEADHIPTWLKAYKEGNIAPYVKSEPIPETNNEPVKVVVGENLQDIVFKSGKNVLLEFYAPWCGHCKQLAPILEEVAISYQSDANVIIAKLDATANDIPSDTFEVQGYPTLYFRSSSGTLSQYDGGRTKEDIIEFIEKNRDKPAQQEQDKPAHQEQVKDEQETGKDEL